MITTHCPRCSESIRLPSAQLPEDAYAQCPICRETFPASDVIDRLPPVLNFIGADGNPLQIDLAEREHVVVNQPADLGDELPGGLDENEVQESVADESNPFFDPATAGAAAVGIAGATVAGVAGAGATMLGLGNGVEEDAEDEIELEELVEEEESDYEEDAESEIEVEDEVEEYVESEFAETDPQEYEEEIDPELDGGFNEEDMFDEDPEVDASKQTVLLDTWQESPDDDVNALDMGGDLRAGETAVGAASLGMADQANALTPALNDLNVVEDSLEEPRIQPGFNEKTAPKTVRNRSRSSRKKSSPIKTVLGLLLGPVIAAPLVGGLLLAIGKAPDLGFYPFDGSFGKGGASQSVAAATAGDISTRSQNATFGETSGLDAPEMPSPGQDNFPNNPDTPPSLSGALPAPNSGAESIPPGPASAASGMGFPTDLADNQGAESTQNNGVEQTAAIDAFSGSASTNAPTDDDPFGGAISMKPPQEPQESKETNAVDDATAPPDLAEKLMNLGGASDTSTGPVGNLSPLSTNPASSPDSPAQSTDADELFGPPSSDPASSNPIPAGQKLPPTIQDSPNLVASTAMAASELSALKSKQATGTATKRDIVTAYIAVAKVAEQQSSPDSPSVNGLLGDIASSTAIDVFGGDTAKQWFAVPDAKRPTGGILIIGTTDATGTTITLPTGHSVPVISASGIRLPASAKVMALGEIIDSAAMTIKVKNVVSL